MCEAIKDLAVADLGGDVDFAASAEALQEANQRYADELDDMEPPHAFRDEHDAIEEAAEKVATDATSSIASDRSGDRLEAAHKRWAKAANVDAEKFGNLQTNCVEELERELEE